MAVALSISSPNTNLGIYFLDQVCLCVLRISSNSQFPPHLPKITNVPLSPSCHTGLPAKSNAKTTAGKLKVKIAETCPEESKGFPTL